MTFTRTQSGLSNYGKFVGADILIYTEGKNVPSTLSDDHIYDELFYEALVKSVFPQKTVKIKCLGNRTTALEYAEKLNAAGTTNSLVIVDRDGEDFICTLIPTRNIIYTDGYSWENDFWSQKIIVDVLEDLACSKKYSESLCIQLKNATKRLALLSGLDICAHSNKECLFPKTGTSCGIGFDFKRTHVIPTREIGRLISEFRKLGASLSPICRQILPTILNERSDRRIQGHLWEHVVISLINYGISGGQKSQIPKKNIKNLAMSKFRKSPSTYLAEARANYYKAELEARFSL